MNIELSGIWTLALALVTIEVGKWFNRRLDWLERSNIPPAVSAGLVISLLLALLRETAVLDVKLTTAPPPPVYGTIGRGGKVASYRSNRDDPPPIKTL